MISFDENALICDLAETYNIYDYRSLPLRTVATLAVGLRGNSRIMMKMRGAEISGDASFLLAMIIDRFRDVMVGLGIYDENSKPASAVDLFLGKMLNEEEPGKYEVFDTVEDFEEARKKILR